MSGAPAVRFSPNDVHLGVIAQVGPGSVRLLTTSADDGFESIHYIGRSSDIYGLRHRSVLPSPDGRRALLIWDNDYRHGALSQLIDVRQTTPWFG